jgi:hypothetical protein
MFNIQFDWHHSQYDDTLTYTFKPNNVARFSTFEFSTTIKTNSRGLRDDESSLIAPEIIVLGDSHAMGWGVKQEETYSQILEKRINKRVLNTGISSFGTVREAKLLNTLDVSHLKYLVIHYSVNDLYENKYYFEHKDLKIMSRFRYNYICFENFIIEHSYYPGKYFVTLLVDRFTSQYWKYKTLLVRSINKIIRNGIESPTIHEQESSLDSPGEFFLNALQSMSVHNISSVQIIVISDDLLMINSLKRLITERRDDLPDIIKEMKCFGIPLKSIEPQLYYPVDDHMNSNGHAVIAEQLCGIIQGAPYD